MERDTRQRRAIRKAIHQAGRPLSPQEVLDSARVEVPNLGIATVYRTVKGLTEEGKLVPVEMPGEPQRYEESGKHHHHHFCCRVCGRVFEMKGCPQGLGNMLPEGCVMEDHEVFIYGRCSDCVSA
ncbi:MAG: transcriptional repressor [Candidatus Hydrogenedentes bacterium]|nr:transcriptional repressor [Candidatus Hydrogenedentota bacterium]